MFRVGQKVVCVDASEFEQYLDQDAIYTVTSIRMPFISVNCRPGPIETTTEAARGYYARRFRPIVERKTDISIFKAMLTPAGKEKVDG